MIAISIVITTNIVGITTIVVIIDIDVMFIATQTHNDCLAASYDYKHSRLVCLLLTK